MKHTIWLAILGMLCLTGCPGKVIREPEPIPSIRVVKISRGVAKKKLLPKHLRHEDTPKNIQSIIVRKGQDFQAFLLKDKTMSPVNPDNKDWKTRDIGRKGRLQWFIKLNPRGKNPDLGVYVSIRVVIALYGGMMGSSRPGFFNAELYLRRGGKDTLLFTTMLKASGRSYARYDLSNREIADNTKIQKGDILIFRLRHRRGAYGAVGIGGGLGLYGSQIVISNSNTGYYKFLSK